MEGFRGAGPLRITPSTRNLIAPHMGWAHRALRQGLYLQVSSNLRQELCLSPRPPYLGQGLYPQGPSYLAQVLQPPQVLAVQVPLGPNDLVYLSLQPMGRRRH